MTWLRDPDIDTAREALLRAQNTRRVDEDTAQALERAAEELAAESERQFEALYPEWNRGVRLGNALDSGTCPPDIERLHYRTSADHFLCIAAHALGAADGDLRAAVELVPNLPVPVRSVLRGYSVQDGVIVVDLPYSSDIGLVTPPEDDEF